jgi:hypothetical protein
MSQQTISRLSAAIVALGAAVLLAACDQNPHTAWTGPGWYLQLPYPVIAGGPSVYGGPYSYDKCEEDRMSRERPDRYLCVREVKQPDKFGIF